MDASAPYRLSEIGDVAGSLRPFLERMWQEWKAFQGRPLDPFETVSAGMCGFTSAFLAHALEALEGGIWKVSGGRPLAGGGITCTSGRQNGHFWVESEDGVIVDLTADQFGLPAVIVTTSKDPRFSNTFTSQEIDNHLPKIEGVALYWLEKAAEEGLLPQAFRCAA